MNPRQQIEWTDENVATLRALWAEGLSCRLIGLRPFAVKRVRGDDEKPWWIETAGSVYRFPTEAEAVDAAVKMFRHWIDHPAQSKHRARAALALKGKDLACFCPLGQPCHADVLLEIANATPATGAKPEEPGPQGVAP